jgi:3-isopropylmalate/(R)-2-methylmalate dehydratase small subunit
VSERFELLRGAAAPLLRANIDTDTISPGSKSPARQAKAAEFNAQGSRTLAADLFGGWRYDEGGDEVPDFVLNRPEFRTAKILLAGRNFGCGSSRESAVWMLKEWGLRCIIAPSFGEIFYGSCFKNAVLPIQLDESAVAQLALEAEPGAPGAIFEVDLRANEIRTPLGRTLAIDVPKLRRDALLEGLDEIDLTLGRDAEIGRFEAEAARVAAWLYCVRGS